MKNLAFAALLLSSLGQAIHIPGWERPMYRADLRPVDVQGQLHAKSLVMQKRDGAKFATSFTLVEETGIVCITTPCPTERTSFFRVLDSAESKSNTIHYHAIEVNPVLPNPRELYVVDFGTHWLRPENRWEVSIVRARGHQNDRYEGFYEPVLTIMGGVDPRVMDNNE